MKNANAAMIAIAPIAAPTPIPAFAPVDNPLLAAELVAAGPVCVALVLELPVVVV